MLNERKKRNRNQSERFFTFFVNNSNFIEENLLENESKNVTV